MTRRLTPGRAIGFTLAGLAALFAFIQLVPYGRAHANPPVVREPAWDDPGTRALAVRACFDCHSNETTWPWYSHVAPMSWFVQTHVDVARKELNFSEWHTPQPDAEAADREILSQKMPMAGYLWLHPASRLNPDESQTLARGLRATLDRELPGAVTEAGLR